MERRNANRWKPEGESRSLILCAGKQEEVTVDDVSVSGMRVSFLRPFDVGADFYAKLRILPEMEPFYVTGKVIRTYRSRGYWETAFHFEKVRTFDFLTPPKKRPAAAAR